VPGGAGGRGRRPRRVRAAEAEGPAVPSGGRGEPAGGVPAGPRPTAHRRHALRGRPVPVGRRAADAVLPAAPGREPRVPLLRRPAHGAGLRGDHAAAGGRVRRRRVGRRRLLRRGGVPAVPFRHREKDRPREVDEGQAVRRGAADDVPPGAPGVQRLLRRPVLLGWSEVARRRARARTHAR
jgi:hypothetical protein